MGEIFTYRDFGLKEDPFPEISAQIAFGGLNGGPLEFAFFNRDVPANGKTLAEHLPFAGALWHFMNPTTDPFSGMGTAIRPWVRGEDEMEDAKQSLRALYYMLWLLGVDYWCFHDVDLVPTGDSLEEFHANIDEMLPLIKELTELTGIKVGWTTQNLFTFPAYTGGAATNPNVEMFAMAWAQTKKMLDVAKWLQDNGCGAKNHVFWGGREGYRQLLSTIMNREVEQLAAFLKLAVRYAKEIGLDIQFMIEPKACEPSTYQYDHSAAIVISFLRQYDLLEHFKLNLETNHAQLANFTIEHECTIAAQLGLLGGVDANNGTPGNGWDTDRFPGEIDIAIQVMLPLMRFQGDLGRGVINFDAHLDRESCTLLDLVHAYILGMDTMALGAMTAAVLVEEGELESITTSRFSSWDSEMGQAILNGTADFEEVAAQGHKRNFAMTADDSAHHEKIRGILLRAQGKAFQCLAT